MSEDSIEQGIYQNLESLLSQAQEQEQRANAEAARANYQQVLEFAQEEATAAPNLDWESLVGKAKAGLSRLHGQTYHDVEAALSQAEEQEQRGNTETARSIYQQVIESAREQMQAAPDRDWETLIRSAEAGISRLDARNYVRRGKEAMQQHEFVPAAGAFRTAVEKLGSDDPEARQGLAQALYEQGRQNQSAGKQLAAREDYEQALKYWPDHAAARQALLDLDKAPVARQPFLRLGVGLFLLAILVGAILVFGRPPLRPPRPPLTAPVVSDNKTPAPQLTSSLPVSPPTVPMTAPVVTPSATPPNASPVVTVTAATGVTPMAPLSLTFNGKVLRRDGSPVARLRYVQLYGSEDGSLGTRLLAQVITTGDGEFSLATTERFPYYLLWLEPTPNSSQVVYVSVSVGRGGEAAGVRAIRYRNPGSGVYDDNQFYVAFNTPTPTHTPKPAATRTPTPSPSPALFPAPVLLSPEEGATASDRVTFAWDWRGGPLPPNYGFEVRLWKNNQADHYGAAAAVTTTRLDVNLEGAYGVSEGGTGRYYWTVAVVKLQPYQRVGLEAPARVIDIGDGGLPPPPPS
jgi:hypothetical protein